MKRLKPFLTLIIIIWFNLGSNKFLPQIFQIKSCNPTFLPKPFGKNWFKIINQGIIPNPSLWEFLALNLWNNKKES